MKLYASSNWLIIYSNTPLKDTKTYFFYCAFSPTFLLSLYNYIKVYLFLSIVWKFFNDYLPKINFKNFILSAKT